MSIKQASSTYNLLVDISSYSTPQKVASCILYFTRSLPSDASVAPAHCFVNMYVHTFN